MLLKASGNVLLVLVLFCLGTSLTGCADKDAPKGPEMGELDRYLEEHPEEREISDEMMDEMDEENEFEGAEG